MSAAGARVDEHGNTIIPGSRRPDGTYRKEIRVRAGYVPPDEQPKFQTRGNIFAAERKALGVVGAQLVEEKKPSMSKTQKKNEKRKQKRQEAAAAPNTETPAAAEAEIKAAAEGVAAMQVSQPESHLDEVAKQLRTLKKKLRQIDDLQAKIDRDGLDPNPEQLEKLSKRGELEQKIAQLQDQ